MVITLAVLVGMFFLFGGLPRFYTSVNHYTVLLTTAPASVPAPPVRRSGVKIGQVSKVDLDDETGQVRVEIEVFKQYTIRRNRPPILRHTVLGDASIDFRCHRRSRYLPRRPPTSDAPPRSGATSRARNDELAAAEEATLPMIAQVPPPKPALHPVPPTVPSCRRVRRSRGRSSRTSSRR